MSIAPPVAILLGLDPLCDITFGLHHLLKDSNVCVTMQNDFGPGYRVCFGKDGERLVIVLGGGMKKRQQRDIEQALLNWHDYKHRKK